MKEIFQPTSSEWQTDGKGSDSRNRIATIHIQLPFLQECNDELTFHLITQRYTQLQGSGSGQRSPFLRTQLMGTEPSCLLCCYLKEFRTQPSVCTTAGNPTHKDDLLCVDGHGGAEKTAGIGASDILGSVGLELADIESVLLVRGIVNFFFGTGFWDGMED